MSQNKIETDTHHRSAKSLRAEPSGFVARESIRFTALAIVIGAACCAPNFGCAAASQQARHWMVGDWVADYQTGERLARDAGTGLAIYFTDVSLTRHDPMRAAVKKQLRDATEKPYVGCVLFQDHEPDRRYVEQYGVERSPALILVHPDATYHARTGNLKPTEIAEFVKESIPPGQRPRLNPFLPREPDYSWTADLESARRRSAESGRPLLVVLDRWMTRDWGKMRGILARQEVYSRLADMVHCRPGSLWSSAGSAARQLGVMNLPALVIVEPQGAMHILELPTSYEAVIRFADRVRAEMASASQPRTPDVATAAMSVPTGK